MATVRKGPWKATDDAGNVYAVEVITEMISLPHFEGTATVPGLSRIRTTSGESLERIGKGEYRIISTGTVIRSSDPKAE